MKTLKICSGCRAPLPDDWARSLCSMCLESQTVETAHTPAVLPDACGGGFSPPHPDALHSLFPQLEILGMLGVGGMGVVYRARQRGLDRMVALKILPPKFSGDPAFAERFAREARMLARLNHPNIVDVHDLGQTGPLYYFVMEFVDGVSLRHMLQRQRLPVADALTLVSQIAEALEYAHAEGIVHRDIKPENILLDQKGRVKIADFGVSKLLDDPREAARLTQPDHVLGTMHYMAPEQFENPVAVDHRADLYSVGVMLYEMLTGELPLGRFDLPSQRAGVDERLDDLVLGLLAKDPSRRCQRARDLKRQVEEIAGMPTRISAEVSRKLSYEYRTRTALFGWPLVHIATGVDPATGQKRTASGIIALGNAPRGIIAFGDVAVGVIACGIFGYGIISVSIVAVGVVALGTVAAGLGLAMGGIAVAPVAIGGAVLGYYGNGALAWGKHALSPGTQGDPLAVKFFNPRAGMFIAWVFRACLLATPVFLVLGFIPAFMASLSERRRKRRFRRLKDAS